jgi:hypothetical protein
VVTNCIENDITAQDKAQVSIGVITSPT